MDSFIHKQPQKSKSVVILTRQSRDAVKLMGGKSQLSESLERVWCGLARDSTFPMWWAAKSGFGSTISHLFLRTGRGQGTSWEVGLAC